MNNGPRIVISVELTTPMDDYLDALKEAAAKFVLYDVPEGARIGVTSFTDADGKEELKLTTVSDDDDSRQDIVDVVKGLSTASIQVDCVEKGLSESLEVGKDFESGLIQPYTNFSLQCYRRWAIAA